MQRACELCEASIHPGYLLIPGLDCCEECVHGLFVDSQLLVQVQVIEDGARNALQRSPSVDSRQPGGDSTSAPSLVPPDA